jgi:Angiotensin-converting enzyme
MYRLCIFAGVYPARSAGRRRDSFSRNRKSFQTAAAPGLYDILKKGATEDWHKVLKEATGEEISTRAMMEYFNPLMSWLEQQNKGRQIGWE